MKTIQQTELHRGDKMKLDNKLLVFQEIKNGVAFWFKDGEEVVGTFVNGFTMEEGFLIPIVGE